MTGSRVPRSPCPQSVQPQDQPQKGATNGLAPGNVRSPTATRKHQPSENRQGGSSPTSTGAADQSTVECRRYTHLLCAHFPPSLPHLPRPTLPFLHCPPWVEAEWSVDSRSPLHGGSEPTTSQNRAPRDHNCAPRHVPPQRPRTTRHTRDQYCPCHIFLEIDIIPPHVLVHCRPALPRKPPYSKPGAPHQSAAGW